MPLNLDFDRKERGRHSPAMALSVSTAQFFAGFRESNRSLHLGDSHASLIQYYASKSDSGKFAQLNVDSDRIHLPGDEIRASITINPATLLDLESIELDFKVRYAEQSWSIHHAISPR